MLTKLGIVLCSTALSAAIAVAGDRPDWTERAMFTWGEETYFVGVATCARSLEEGRERSYEAARRELAHYMWPTTPVTTQRIFEERPGEGCAPGQVNVWRLLKFDSSAPLVLEPPKRTSVVAPTAEASQSWLARSLERVGKIMSNPHCPSCFWVPKEQF